MPTHTLPDQPGSALLTQPLDTLVREHLHPQLAYFFDRLAREREHMAIDGVAALRSNDQFLPGKIALGLSYVLLESQQRSDPALPAQLQTYAGIARLTAGMPNRSWGIYYHLLALVRLAEAGLLERAIDAPTLAQLRQRLDWRSFVREDGLTLIDLPSNYYGVAFSVARLRLLLGWDDGSAAERLLDKTLAHYARYSADHGFSDETEGEGRFDRYSVLLIAEICQRFVQTGLAVPEALRGMLRKAVDLTFKLLHPDGHAFSFGRSLGPYGDSAAAEIFSVAAYLGVLRADEVQPAYSYCTRSLARYLDFWFNDAIHSVDMWGQGRRTDTYRAKHRILGENFSLIHQYISCNTLWNGAGLQGRPPMTDLAAWLARTQPACSLTWFARGRHERALVVVRDGPHVFSLPLINGGPGQHDNSPYYPLPFAEDVVAGIADSGAQHPQLLPKITLADGSQLLPTSYMRDIASGSDGKAHWVRCTHDAMNRLGAPRPQADERLQLHTRYEFAPGCITRIDRFSARQALDIADISLDFLSFSAGPATQGTTTHFASGQVRSIEVQGLALHHSRPTTPDDAFKSPSGPMRSWLQWRSGPLRLDQPLTLRWTLRYDTGPPPPSEPPPAA